MGLGQGPEQGRLAGRVALVTGGGRGLGRAVCEVFAREGAWVAPLARRGDELDELVEALCERGGDAIPLLGDIGDYAAVAEAVAIILRWRGRLDIVVNNAGAIEPIARTWEADPDKWHRNVTTNLVGAFNVCRAALPHMLERGDGCIINVSSGAARGAVRGWGAYCAAKAGLDHFTRVLVEELGDGGVRANVVYPGVMDTRMQAEIRDAGEQGFGRENLARFRGYKEHGVLRPPAEPAALIAWVAASPDVRGEFLSVDDPATMARAGFPPDTRHD